MIAGVAVGHDAAATKGVTLAAVAAGGAIGSLGRWGVSLLASGAPWGTLAVNLTGALAMGVLVAWLAAGTRHPLARPFLSVGLLGGWTTYSTFALDGHALAEEGLVGLLGYLAATLGLGVGAALAGLVIGDRLWGEGSPADAARLDAPIAQEEL